MKRLNRFLPAFSADYTGASSVVYGMEGILVGHDPISCSTHAFITDEPRIDSVHKPFFSTCINEIEAVVGNDEKHIKKMIQLLEYFDAKFMTIIGTPVTSVIGTDFLGIAKVFEKRTGVPTIGVDTTGFELYDEGIVKVYKQLIDKFTGQSYFKATPSEVNVFGTVVLDMWDMDSVIYLEQIIKEAGAETVTCWGADATLEHITGANQSRLNIAVSVSGIEAAKYMEKKYGIPYIIGCPIGENETIEFQSRISEKLGNEMKLCRSKKEKNKDHVKKVLIIGEQVLSDGIRNCLQKEFGIEQVDCVTFFKQESILKRKYDAKVRDEEELINYMKQREEYDIIIGDLRLKTIVGAYGKKYLEWPHIVMSGQNRLQESFQSIGIYGTRFFEHIL